MSGKSKQTDESMTKKLRRKAVMRVTADRLMNRVNNVREDLDNLAKNLQLFEDSKYRRTEIKILKKQAREKKRKMEEKFNKAQAVYKKVKFDLKKANEDMDAREEILQLSVDRFNEVDQLVYTNYQDKKMIKYLTERGWKGSFSSHPNFDDEDPCCSVPGSTTDCAPGCGKARWEFPVLAPYQLHVDMLPQKQHKAKLATQPLPPLRSDSVKDQAAGTSSGKAKHTYL